MKQLKTFIVLVLISSIYMSCNQPPKSDLYRTTGQEYASRSQKWILKFPKMPALHNIESKMGDITFNVKSYQVSMPNDEYYTLNLINYSEHYLNTISTEDIYYNSVERLLQSSAVLYRVDTYEDVVENGLDAKTFKLTPMVNKAVNPGIEGKIIIHQGKIYSVIYVGKNKSKARDFIKSFKLFS